MTAHTTTPPDRTGYAAGPVTKPPTWHGLVAWDLMFNNLSTGLFLAAAVGELTAPAVVGPVARAAYPLALVLLFADLLCLVLDLGDPLRFHHMLRVFKPTSPMSLGTWCLTVYSVPLTAAVALGLVADGRPALEWVRKAAVVVAILPALGSALYKGVLFSTTAQPGWRDARWLGGYLSSSVLLLGTAGLLLLAGLLGHERAMAVLRPAAVVLLVLNAVFLGLLALDLRPTLSRTPTRGQLAGLAALGVGAGTVLPLVLLLATDRPGPVVAAVLSLLLGSLAIRFAIVRLPHGRG
jgi:hypothetical protein